MDLLKFLLHLDDSLKSIITNYGTLTYIIIFLIIFAETGLVIIPFLPGDSLLFVIGTLAGGDYLNIWIAYFVLLAAAIIGDSVNYWIGSIIGPRVFAKENSRIFKKEYLVKTSEFYAKYGGKTIILARFVPIVRTFAPFVAGVGKMDYRTFIVYNIVGGFLWVTILTFAGYFFGGLTVIKNNFEYAVIGIVLVSLVPMIIEYLKHKTGPTVSKEELKSTNYEELKKTFKKENY